MNPKVPGDSVKFPVDSRKFSVVVPGDSGEVAVDSHMEPGLDNLPCSANMFNVLNEICEESALGLDCRDGGGLESKSDNKVDCGNHDVIANETYSAGGKIKL